MIPNTLTLPASAARRPPVDLRHLRIFLGMYHLRSVSRTAEHLGMAQSSISIALSRLRAHYGDPLFVRTGQTMQPTDRAALLAPAIEHALQILDEADRRTPEFVPALAMRRFTLALADAGKIVVLPRIARILETAAPGVSLQIQNINSGTPEALESEGVDLAFGFMSLRKSGLYSQRLFQDFFVCISSSRSKFNVLTQEIFDSAGHVILEDKVSSAPLLRHILEKNRPSLRIAMSVPTPFGLAEVIAATELIATIPYRMAKALNEHGGLRIHPLPFDSPAFDVGQHWHGRLQHDEGHKWLRKTIFEAFRGLDAPDATPFSRTAPRARRKPGESA